MKRRQLVFVVMALLAAAAPASAAHFALGAYGGFSIPVAQDDNGTGPQFGVRVPVLLFPKLTVEPYWAKTVGGDKEQAVIGATYTRTGIDVTSLGFNVLVPFGEGFQFYPYAGIGSNRTERTGLDETTLGYTFGLGFGYRLGMNPVVIHARGGINAVLEEATNSESSRNWGDITIGVSYDLYNHLAKE